MPNQPSSSALHRELSHLRWKLGLKTAFRTFGVVGLGLTAFDLGWTMGTGIRSIFTGGGEAPAKPAEAEPYDVRMVPVSRGDSIAGGGSVLWQVTLYAPSDGWVLQGLPGGSYWFTSGFERDPGCHYEEGAIWRSFPGFVVISRNAGAVACLGGGPTVHALFRALPSVPPSETIPPGTWPGAGSVGVQPDYRTVRQSVLDELDRNPSEYRTLIQWLDNRLGGPSPDPIFDVQVAGQQCLGLSAAACVRELEQLGFEDVTVHTLDFDHAATGIPGDHVTAIYQAATNSVIPTFDPATVTVAEDYPILPIGTIVPAPLPATIAPPTQTYTLKADRRLVVVTNPAPAVMPTRVLLPLPHETYEQYAQRALGRNYMTTRSDLAAEQLDPARGPDEAVRTQPVGRVRQGTSVVVYTNPPSAPPPVGGGQCATPPIRAFDLTPLQVPVGEKFPFGVFTWMFGALGGWSGGGEAPEFIVPFVHGEITVDFATFEPAMVVVRPVVVVLAFLSLAWLLASAALGFGGSQADD